jgi:hypothetical protein
MILDHLPDAQADVLYQNRYRSTVTLGNTTKELFVCVGKAMMRHHRYKGGSLLPLCIALMEVGVCIIFPTFASD